MPIIKAQSTGWPYREALDSLLALEGVTPASPGFSICIVEKGRIVYEKQAGLANVGKKIPITEKTIFNIGSMAKQFTAMCIFLLEEAGKLKVTDEIHRYIPELPDYGYPITIQQMIWHTSGIRSYPEMLSMENKSTNKRLRNDKMMAFQQQFPVLNFPPGEDYNYSNTGYMLLGIIVERVSGMTLAAFSQAHIFAPLGMRDTHFQQDGQKGVAGGTASYEWKPGSRKFIKEIAFVDALGATGVHTTLRDLVLWDQNFYHNRLGAGTQALIEKMEAPGPLNSGSSTFYGGGLFIRHGRGFPEVEHSGGWGSFSSQCRQFPQQQISILTAANGSKSTAYRLNDAICNILFRDSRIIAPVARPLPAGLDPASLTGVYLSDNNWVRQVRIVDSSLYILLGNGAKAPKRRLYFSHSDDKTIMFRDSFNNPVAFYLTDGHVGGFRWTGGHYFPLEINYKKMVTANAVDLAGLGGVYKSPDFGNQLSIKFHQRSNRLVMHPFPFVKYDLVPVADGVFEIPDQDILVRFSENKLVIGDTWNRGIVFLRRIKKR